MSGPGESEGGAGEGPAASRPIVLTLCTGNAARSVMAGAMLEQTPVRIITAGTHVVEGQPMGMRTKSAMTAVGFRADGHRSHQLTDGDIEAADLVVAMAGEHVSFVRRTYPGAASKTGSIKRLCRDLLDGPESLGHRVAVLGLANQPVEEWEDVEDPAGGEEDVYLACVKELADLCAELRPRLH